MTNLGGSAKVTLTEQDFSTRVPSFPGVYGAISIPALKGDINKPTLVTGDSQFLKRYTPNEKIDIGMDNSHYSALNFLQQSDKLWVNRVALNALYSIMLYSSGKSDLPVLNFSDVIGVDTTSDTIGITASFTKYLNDGDIVRFTTDDTLPAPLAVDTDYFIIKKDNGTIQLANTYEEATYSKKAITTDINTNLITIGTPINFTTDLSNDPERLLATGHGASEGDLIRLSPNPVAPVAFTTAYLTDDEVLNFSTSHGLVDNQVITLSTSGTLPSGLVSATTYYVTVVTTTSIKVSLTSGGSYVSFTDNGTGSHQVDAGILPAPLAPKSFTVTYLTNANNLVFGTAHGLVDGQQVRLSTSGTLPTSSPALDTETFYYVSVVDANTITISLTDGGIPLTFSANGTSPNYVNPEIHYALPLTANTLSVEPVIGNGAITFTGTGFGYHKITKPHGISDATPIQLSSVVTTKKFTTNQVVSNKTFYCTNHGLTNDTVVLLSNDKTTPDLPNGLTNSTRYYVVNASANSFELSTTLGSLTQATFSDDGTGSHYFNTGVLPNASGGELAFNTTYYAVNTFFDTLQVSNTPTGIARDLTDYGSGTILLERGFIDLTSVGVDSSYLHRTQFAKSVKSTNFTIDVTNNRLTLDSNVVSLLDNGTSVKFTSQGVLPSPLLTDAVYYVIKYPIQAPETVLQSYHTNSTTIKLATSYQNAIDYTPTNDTSINILDEGSGIHTLYYNRGTSQEINGYEIGNIVENFVINQDSSSETIIVPQSFGERLSTGDVIQFSTSTVGKLPLPLISNTNYYVVKVSDTEFKVATTYENAIAVTPVTLDLTDNVSFPINSTSVNASTDTITLPISLSTFGSMLSTGTPVTLSVVTIGSAPSVNVLSASDKLPKPLKPNTVYYLIKIDDLNYKLASNINDAVLGVAIDLTDGGSGDDLLLAIEGTNMVTFVPSVTDPTSFSMGSDDILLFYSANEGAWGNDIFVRLEDYRNKESDAFLVKVFKRSNLNIPVETHVCSRKNKKDGRGRNIYIQDVLESSAYIRCFDNTLIDDDIFPMVSIPTSTNPNVRSLVAGHDGDTVTEGLMIQSLDKFRNTEEIPITVLMDGGWSFPSFQRELDAIAQERQDCVAILSVPFDREANSDYLNSIVQYRNLDLNLNSSYSSLYSSSPLVYDKYNDRKIYISPDGFVGALISATGANYELWYPVAGFKRGVLNILDVRRRFTKGEMDYLYDNGINPIRFTIGKGILVWGQKTLLNRPSVLDRLNVRLLLIVIEPAIKLAMEDFLFELNDITTRNLAKTIIESYLEGIKAKRGISDFKVIIDDSNNTPEDIDNHVMNVWIFIRPVGSLEYCRVDLITVSNSVSFSLAEASL